MSQGEQIHQVNHDFGDDVSNMLYEASKITWENRPGAVHELHPSFSGLRVIHKDYIPRDSHLGSGSDGIGTKVEVAERLKDHSTIAHDLFAMACDDAVIRGAAPIAMNTVLDVNKLVDNDVLTKNALQQIGEGYVSAAKAAGVVILNGETAELGDRIGGYGPFNYNWCGTVQWFILDERLLTGHKVEPGDALIGLAETGFRSNGITKVRTAMLENYGPEWHDQVEPSLSIRSLGELVIKPSIIYSALVSEMHGGHDLENEPKVSLHGAAHITGGGQPGKIGRMLEPSGHGAYIDNPIEPPAVMRHVQGLIDLSDEEAYQNWHMGPGMVLAVPESEAAEVELLAANRNILAQRIGTVREEPGITIANRGVQAREEFLHF